ncbi:carbohydrate-binding module family 1 protein [Cylindrobasidium torrendii FP15055 ss-10]|uniref:Carbohydrate-binding module family 1 protein n=1 Tax=Cylindrobasidium torrendii FP15055 ss-10 TaxID=1314674 RepID=A0A0D7B7I8_9AGAR|nr:carbohydrate-binding module family 1 protein [Cylindrobasidium torrendii FP15055 ss-10]
MFSFPFSLAIFALAATQSTRADSYNWKNVKIGGGGGFVPGIVFNPSEKASLQGLAYVRTDIGGAYRLNADDSWTPLTDFVSTDNWNMWGVDALATDPVDTGRLYLATGMYTNSWDPSNGHILRSTDKGDTFEVAATLPFKVGGNMPGRGTGERLAIDPNSNNILFFGARSGNGLYKSSDYGSTWTKVSSLPNPGTYIFDPNDTNEYNNDAVGVTFVTFDASSGSSGSATPRIFVGVMSNGTDNVFVSEDSGSTWSGLPGQQHTYFPHKGVISPSEGLLYLSYSDGVGPYDGVLGAVYKYDIASKNFTNITPVSGSNLYFGFGGLAVDIQTPGTIMVAALNSWWPDGQIYRSTDSGATWSPLWSWVSYPTLAKYYSYSDSLAPWLGPNYVDLTLGNKQIGWMMESLVIDPFDSNHLLYGTGATIYGSHDLKNWDSKHNISIASLADGIEETAVQALISPPTGPNLLSGVYDIGGFAHTDLNGVPAASFPNYVSTVDLDFAGNKPTNIVRVGNGGDTDSAQQISISTDSGATWNLDYGASSGVYGGKVAFSADADTVLWRPSTGQGVLRSQYTNSFTSISSLPTDAIFASDKKDNTIFYAASGSSFYISTDTGSTFAKTAGTLANTTTPVRIVVNPNTSGDVWVSTNGGLLHSTDSGATFTKLAGVTQAWSISLGAPASTNGYPAVFAAANIGGVGYFRSDDQGTTWTKLDDAAHGFGAISANVISGDPRVYGRVYIGTNGRGIFYGDRSSGGGTLTVTTAASSTTTRASSTLGTTSTTTRASSASSTTSRASSTTIPSTSSSTTSSAPASTQSAYGQCGGASWSGPTACASGYTCHLYSDYYAQCVPS